MRKIISAAGAVLLGAAVSASVNVSANDGLYFGPSASYYYLDSERYVGGDEEAVVGGLNLGYKFLNNWAVEIGAGTEIANSDFDMAKLDLYYWLSEDTDSWRPYVTIGAIYYEQDISQSSGPTLVDSDEDTTWQSSLGFGMSKMLNTHWEFRSDVRWLYQFEDESNNDASLNLALNYYFKTPVAAPVVVEAVPEPEYVPPPAPEPEVRSITVRLNVEFEFDKAVVRAVYGDELEAVANAMKVHDDIELVLEGHTDSQGGEQYNQGLSERRVVAVEAKLAADYGIDPARISTVGYGETRPIADNDTKDGRARNRRVIGEMTYTEVVVD